MNLQSGVIFVGCGASSSIPILNHVLSSEKYNCLCNSLVKTSDCDRKNHRNNVSLLIRMPNLDPIGDKYYNILIDLGKTFRDAVLSIFPSYGISSIDSVLITHHHDDAVAGIGSIQFFYHKNKIPIYMNPETLSLVNSRFKSTIMNHSYEKDSDGSINKMQKYEINVFNLNNGCLERVENKSDIDKYCNISSSIKDTEFKNIEFIINGIKITAFPMNHGQCICMGYCFHFPDTNLIYISDYTFPMITSSVEFLYKTRNKKTILILDSISYSKISNAHANIKQSLEFITDFSPDYVYFIGMACSLEYKEGNEMLNKELINLKNESKCINTVLMEIAYDGLFLPINFDSFLLSNGN
ncbi:PhnP like hydrolase of the metallobetalactamase fold [Cryptosporidium ryanae]|uniref:PhnP like hydrolase of the metallobetalactamase fold n=1 Tax=Cryptosporidium ryanae TaxID=515981 RepID=UPI003519FD9C|nr:PhnP like hydrolase of the metallobetalactamase fold [Cryptosporidium ryanae]